MLVLFAVSTHHDWQLHISPVLKLAGYRIGSHTFGDSLPLVAVRLDVLKKTRVPILLIDGRIKDAKLIVAHFHRTFPVSPIVFLDKAEIASPEKLLAVVRRVYRYYWWKNLLHCIQYCFRKIASLVQRNADASAAT